MTKFFEKPIYFCSACKKILTEIDDLFFVEETSPRCFCSEKCIETFYFPLIDEFEKQKSKMRKEVGVVEEDLEEYLTFPQYVDKLFSTPNEIWRYENLLKEEIYIYLMEAEIDGEPLYFIALALVFSFRPSFVLGVDVTRDKKVVDAYKMGEKVKDLKPYYDAIKESSEEEQPAIDLAEIEQRKSQLLAVLLENRKDTDIQMEQYHLYETYTFPTIENPELVAEWSDDNGELYHICTKAFELKGSSFYYIVVCMPGLSEHNFVPILGFPTVDGDLYQIFTAGKRLSGVLKN